MRSIVQKPTAAVALTGTQYLSTGGSAGVPVSRFTLGSWSIDHPAATTTAYTVQGSDMDGDDVSLGQDDWHDLSAPASVSKSAAEKFAMNVVDIPYARLRLKAVTTVGSSAVTVRETFKGPY